MGRSWSGEVESGHLVTAVGVLPGWWKEGGAVTQSRRPALRVQATQGAPTGSIGWTSLGKVDRAQLLQIRKNCDDCGTGQNERKDSLHTHGELLGCVETVFDSLSIAGVLVRYKEKSKQYKLLTSLTPDGTGFITITFQFFKVAVRALFTYSYSICRFFESILIFSAMARCDFSSGSSSISLCASLRAASTILMFLIASIPRSVSPHCFMP